MTKLKWVLLILAAAVTAILLVNFLVTFKNQQTTAETPISVPTTEIRYVYITPTPTPTPEIIDYTWKINGAPAGTNGAYEPVLEFTNLGTVDLYNVIFKLEFYTASGKFYSESKFNIGNISVGKTTEKVIKIPLQYFGSETWTNVKTYVSVNGIPFKEDFGAKIDKATISP